MPKTLSVTLDDDQERFVAEQEAERDRIRAALIAGEESGIVETSVTEIFSEVIAEYQAKHC